MLGSSRSSSSSSFVDVDPEVKKQLDRYRGVWGKWRNNNTTVVEKDVCVLETTFPCLDPKQILPDLWLYNMASDLPPIVMMPVAGCHVPKGSWYDSILEKMKLRVKREYKQSFSLPDLTAGAQLYLRVAQAAQKIRLFKEKGKWRLRVSAGVTVEEAEAYLHKRKLAFRFVNNPTIQKVSVVGALANDCYGPGKNHPSMTGNIAEMRVISPKGELLNLRKKGPHKNLFRIFRHRHMGAAFYVRDVVLKNITRRFRVKRTSVLYKDYKAFKKGMKENDWIGKEHFIMQFFPVDIEKEGDHFFRYRVVTFERTDEKPKKSAKPGYLKDIWTFLSLMSTEIGEPLIDLIVRSENLHVFLPYLFRLAAKTTFGSEENVVEIGWSHLMAHIFDTYTDLPIHDVNWLIDVEGEEDAQELLLKLMRVNRNHLRAAQKSEEYPIFNAFGRYYKSAKTGKMVLSVELLTYPFLAKSMAYLDLEDAFLDFLDREEYKYDFHPGKHLPARLRSLPEVYANDPERMEELEIFKSAVCCLHGGEEMIRFSPILSEAKKRFLGFLEPVEASGKFRYWCTEEQEKRALNKIIELAECDECEDIAGQAREQLAQFLS